MKVLVLLLGTAFILAGCARAQIHEPREAMRPAPMPELADDLDWTGLVAALESQVQFLKEKSAGPQQFTFGPRAVDRVAYVKALEFLLNQAKADASGEKFRLALRSDFEAFEVYGQDRWGEIFMTSYFEPVIKGALKPTGEFTQALYAKPKDMVEVDLGSFVPMRPALSVLDQAPLEQRSRNNVLRGRLVAENNPEKNPKIVAYPDRAGIYAGELKDVAKPIAFVNPIDAFVLEIQGSGVVKLPGGKELKVGYAAQNGYPYAPVGKFLFDVIPKEKMTLFTIESHLRTLSPDAARKIMSMNPSFVFFKPLTTKGITFLGNELITGRTIATDQYYFPKGALALLQFDKPQFADASATEPVAWVPVSRFVLDQDTGGAIRGPGRVDLYSGRGLAAKQTAGVMKNKGRLFYFVPRPELLQALKVSAR